MKIGIIVAMSKELALLLNIIENKEEMPLSYDLWENFESIHTYSLASIFSAFNNCSTAF